MKEFAIYDYIIQNTPKHVRNSLNEMQESSLDGGGGFFVGDIESYLDANNEWVFKLLTFTDGVTLYISYDIVEAFNKINELGANIYFHNLDFDLLFFMRESLITNGVTDQPIIISGNKVISMQMDYVVFKNSLALFPMALKSLVKSFIFVDDKEYFENKANVLDLEDEQLELYCAKDSIYLYACILKYQNFFNDNYNTNLKLTTPAIAFNTFHKQFLTDKDFLHTSRRSEFFDDGYYFGGHTEKFVSGKKIFRNINYYDVNSLYPRIMQDLGFINAKLSRLHPTMGNLKRLVKNKKMFYCEVMLDIDSEMLRAFPTLKDGVNRYLTGIRWYKVSELGINFILKYGCWRNIVKVKTIMGSVEKDTIKPFEGYVNEFYKMRKQKGNNLIGKLLLNSLYGKFGQKLEFNVKYINVTKDMPTDPISVSKMSNGNIISTYKETAPEYTIFRNRLDICGKVTEGARLYMMTLINDIRLAGGNVYYTDTDSIMTDYTLEGSPLNHLVDSEKLGLLSNEIGYTDNAIILGQKMYYFYKSGKSATKGLKNLQLKDFKDILRGKSEFFNNRFTRLHTLVDRGFFGIQTMPYSFNKIRERLD